MPFMSKFSSSKEYSQLEDVLQSPIIILELPDHALTLLETKGALGTHKSCCVISATSTSSHKLHNIKRLYQSLVALKKLQRQLSDELQITDTSLIGIYPSLEYPACVYQLHTNADRYVSANVLPCNGSAIVGIIKHIIRRLLGANPAIGGLGLLLYRN
ncbi:hypothetical protein DS878_05105 [Marinobacter sp. F3R11]|nr:hypothetical protein DS878_05105 [Marinobacter sp. F3R11]